MKLLRYGPKGQEKPGLLDAQGKIRDLSGVVGDIDGATLSDASLAKLRALDPASLPVVEGNPRLGPAVGKIGKFICIGLNYADHAAESNLPVPTEPVVFNKWNSAISGPNDDVEIPRGSKKTDWEVELGVVIGGGTWDKGKGFDTFGPIGPWVVTRDEVADPQNLTLWLEVDGHRYQNGTTKTMVFGVAKLVSYLSTCMSLQPGDVISTGTPPGVGMGVKPNPVYLKPGQTIRLGIEGLGEQQQKTYAAE
jgi:ureidoglycolate lyase